MSSFPPNWDPMDDDDTSDEEFEEQMMASMMWVTQKIVEIRQNSSQSRKRRRYIDRNHESGHNRLVTDYFSDEPVFHEDIFRRRFRMRKELFLRIVNVLQSHYEYFQQRESAAKVMGLSPLQKITAAIRQLAYGTPTDTMDEYLHMGETTAVECLFNFCRCVIDVFGAQYLRRPNAQDTARLLHMHEQKHGFLGMLGSLDCMHWEWRNCPVAWKCRFTRGDHGVPTIMLEAVASTDLWIWHAFFGVAGAMNDINVLNQSPLFNDVLQGYAPEVNFTVNGTDYKRGYYLTDGIYPQWSMFVKSFPCPVDPKRILFKQKQEAARKDVERAFGVLQARWAMVRGPGRFWYRENLREIMYTCIILHNMIVEDEGDNVSNWVNEEDVATTQASQGSTEEFQQYLLY
ncbi:uncharacterized protein LOC116004044 [Ipomoea triloba]|uniref:uncharacterized protein LOC116004044 n=1 Tax=Ipomoea triloba TaxID=35885 RepID=UPI00125E002D|nr:uncharacterized protein LOC116004044 [Ipomoea triloba]